MIHITYRMSFLLSVLLYCTVITGCMVGPDYQRPVTEANQQAFYRAPADWIDPNAPSEIGPWWYSFNDPVIDQLVQKALEKNYDLQAATATILEAEALLAQASGSRSPWLDYGANRARSKSPSIFPGIGSEATTSYDHALNIGYVTDLFGKLKRNERAFQADLAATQATQESLIHVIIASVIRSHVRIATQQRLLSVAQATTKSRQSTLQVVERRYSQGLASPVDLYLARENIAASKASEPLFLQSIILAGHALDVLLGNPPGDRETTTTLPDMPNLKPIPLAFRISLLDRRPDVRAAEMQLVAATERIGVSIAQMYPDLTMTASGGYRAAHLDALTLSENEVYSFVMGLTAPVFHGGQIKAQVEAAKARTQRAAANYAGTVINAIREVEDALASEQILQERLAQLEIRLEEARRAESLASERYSRGAEGILTVLETQRRRFLAENELIQTQNQLYNARIDLFLALGGDWDTENKTMQIMRQSMDQDQL
ncbi:MAG: efflux transporter outer membrane subunit [Sedimentisphaerales bacterium]|nr:efflux transporter outer membrane subunit [Sedimentisphaerales bacterium]